MSGVRSSGRSSSRVVVAVVSVEGVGFELLKVLVVELISEADVAFVEALLVGLDAADEKNDVAARVKGVEDANGRSGANTEFPHVRVAGSLDGGGVGMAKIDAILHQGVDEAVGGLLVRDAEGVPPGAELIGVLDGYGHGVERNRRRPEPPPAVETP